MRLYDYAKVIRSKNAGPFTRTIDVIFDEKEKFKNAFAELNGRKKEISKLYCTKSEDVQISCLEQVFAIKVTLPRQISSGGIGDNDVYGCQQHTYLGKIQINIPE